MKAKDEAKELFLAYRGSHFHMEREGDYKRYKSYGISRNTELKWLKEYQAKIFDKLSKASNNKEKAEVFSEYGDVVALLRDIKGYQFMLNYVKENAHYFDSNTLLRTSSTILNVIRNVHNNNMKDNVIKEMVELLKDGSNNISISDDYKEDGVFPEYLSEERISTHMKRIIDHWENT